MKPAKGFKRLTVFTLLANMLILVGIGNSTGFLVLAELILPITIRDISFSTEASYGQLLVASAVLSFIGQVFLVVSLFNRLFLNRIVLVSCGLLFMYAGIFYLTNNFSNDNFSLTGLITAMPFACVSVVLIYNMASRYTRKLNNGSLAEQADVQF